MESFKELFEMVKEYTRQYVIDSHGSKAWSR